METRCKFDIGQKIVAIKDHSKGVFKKGDTFIVLDIERGCCHWSVKINPDNEPVKMYCRYCQVNIVHYGSYYMEECFEPIEEQLSEMTFEQALKLVTPQKQPVYDNYTNTNFITYPINFSSSL